jgi:hypothetical protein
MTYLLILLSAPAVAPARRGRPRKFGVDIPVCCHLLGFAFESFELFVLTLLASLHLFPFLTQGRPHVATSGCPLGRQ